MKPFKLHPSAIDPMRTGLALGALIGLSHLSWSITSANGGFERVENLMKLQLG